MVKALSYDRDVGIGFAHCYGQNIVAQHRDWIELADGPRSIVAVWERCHIRVAVQTVARSQERVIAACGTAANRPTCQSSASRFHAQRGSRAIPPDCCIGLYGAASHPPRGDPLGQAKRRECRISIKAAAELPSRARLRSR